eukprot:COSAG06_NODE_4241_length_4439_cov_1018.693779_5_plen_152_part_00
MCFLADMGALYANWIRTMNDLQTTGCTVSKPSLVLMAIWLLRAQCGYATDSNILSLAHACVRVGVCGVRRGAGGGGAWVVVQVAAPDPHGLLNMSGYCFDWSKPAKKPCDPGGQPCQAISACNITNSYCCLPTPEGSNPRYLLRGIYMQHL